MFPKSNRGFTIHEILLCVVIVLLLGSIAIIGYLKMLDQAREAVCTTNVKALTTAVEAYAMENDALPSILGDLEPQHVKKAYALVWEKSSLWVKLARRLVDIDTSNIAYANFFKYDTLKDYGAARNMFVCPNDKNGGTSYGINKRAKNMKWDDIKDTALLIGDCDKKTFGSEGDLEQRHQSDTVALAGTKNKNIKKRKALQSGETDLAVSISIYDTDNDGDVDEDDNKNKKDKDKDKKDKDDDD